MTYRRVPPEASAVMLFLGILLIFIGFLVIASGAAGGKGQGAGVILIGPFPIIFQGELSPLLLLILALIPVIAFLFFVLYVLRKLAEESSYS